MNACCCIFILRGHSSHTHTRYMWAYDPSQSDMNKPRSPVQAVQRARNLLRKRQPLESSIQLFMD